MPGAWCTAAAWHAAVGGRGAHSQAGAPPAAFLGAPAASCWVRQGRAWGVQAVLAVQAAPTQRALPSTPCPTHAQGQCLPTSIPPSRPFAQHPAPQSAPPHPTPVHASPPRPPRPRPAPTQPVRTRPPSPRTCLGWPRRPARRAQRAPRRRPQQRTRCSARAGRTASPATPGLRYGRCGRGRCRRYGRYGRMRGQTDFTGCASL